MLAKLSLFTCTTVRCTHCPLYSLFKVRNWNLELSCNALTRKTSTARDSNPGQTTTKDAQADLLYLSLLSQKPCTRDIVLFKRATFDTGFDVHANICQTIFWKYLTIACNKTPPRLSQKGCVKNLSTEYVSTSSSQHAPHPGLRWQISLLLSFVQLAYWLIGPMISYFYSSLLASTPKTQTVQTFFTLPFK